MSKAYTTLCMLVLALFFYSVSISAAPIRIAVASNFSFPLKALINQYQQVSKQKIVVSTGSSGVLFAQISKGAPFDLFLSADKDRPRQLELQGLTIIGTRQTYAKGQLAFWQPNNESLSLASLQNLTGRLAIANPRFAPYGVAAQQSLLSLKSNPEQFSKVLGNNIVQTFQFVDSGNADAGLVPLSLLIRAKHKFKNDKYDNYVLLPMDAYQPIEQQLVILKSTKQLAEVTKLSQFLLSESAQDLLHSLGYVK